MKNKVEMCILGMNRSGQHAIIEWILAQCQGKVCYFNNAYKANPLASCKWAPRGDPNGNKDYLVISHENHYIDKIFNDAFRREKERYMGKSDKIYDILIIRDPYNWVASAWRMWEKNGLFQDGTLEAHTREYLIKWKGHAREYLGETHHMHGRVFILFNKWFQDINYRRWISSELGLKFTDEKINVLARTGSSFDDPVKYGNRAQGMNVLVRWKNFGNDESYWSIFDNETEELSDRIFGEIL